MNKYILFLLLICECICFGQNIDNTIYVNYHFVSHFGANTTFNIDASLIANNNSSLYVVYSRHDNYKYSPENEEEDSNNTIKIFNNISNSKDVYVYQNSKDKTLYHTSNIKDKIYRIEERKQDFNWIVLKETKLVGSFLCNKAEVNFRGRNYTAWFTTDIPISSGPWKFSGLPGLILEIYDESKTFSWVSKSIQFPYLEKVSIAEPETHDKIKITLKDYIELVERERKNDDKMRNSKMNKDYTIISSVTKRAGIELTYEWETN
ncbi:GLPGLI family protein [Paucihalobacter ruber]|uniref:GLPGLI family protein n=1 Tax=Paucihalobacter ruber TaxID=2567861 RepID=A0A506PMJ0_9FLAO|nr:GLPGLI family protein [Paucihalobacter ruber]TPV35086.1 GLPGLI family protein [Paucihalobacter ruber]